MLHQTPTAATRLHDRHTTWQTLCSAGAHLLWTPRVCDVALNRYPGVSNIADLADSAAFHLACEEANQLYAYPVASWAPPLARKALNDARFSQLYVDRQVRAAIVRLHLESRNLCQILPDAASMVRTFWAELAVGFQPGTIVGEEIVTWGYEAFLARRLTPMVVNSIGRAMKWSWSTRSILDEERETIGTEPECPEDRWDGRLRSALIEALDVMVTDEVLHDAYFALAYGEETLGEVAASLGLTYHLLHTRLLHPLCARIAKAAGRAMNGRVRICPELRVALAEVLPLDEFTARYSSPCQQARQ